MLFRQAFFKEKTRQWEITKRREKNEKAFAFLSSDNPAAIGKRLDQGYVPKINDSNVIGEVGKRLEILKTDIENLTNEIKTHDQSLFDIKQGRHLKLDWTQFSHDCNLKFIEELRALHTNIQQMADKCKETAERFKRIYGAREKSSSSGALRKKKKKNLKKNKKTKEKIFKRNVEKLFDQICSQEVKEEYIANGFLIPDCEIKVDREGYLRITKSKLKHLVYILDHFNHRAKCTLLDLVPDELGSDLLMALEKEQEEALENMGMRNADADENNDVDEGGSPRVIVDSDESGSEADNMSNNDSDQAADDNMQETVNKSQ